MYAYEPQVYEIVHLLAYQNFYVHLFIIEISRAKEVSKAMISEKMTIAWKLIRTDGLYSKERFRLRLALLLSKRIRIKNYL